MEGLGGDIFILDGVWAAEALHEGGIDQMAAFADERIGGLMYTLPRGAGLMRCVHVGHVIGLAQQARTWYDQKVPWIREGI